MRVHKEPQKRWRHKMTQVTNKKIRQFTEEMIQIRDDETLNKSQKIRKLYEVTQDRGTIADLLSIRYQHVRNVLITPLKKT